MKKEERERKRLSNKEEKIFKKWIKEIKFGKKQMKNKKD